VLPRIDRRYFWLLAVPRHVSNLKAFTDEPSRKHWRAPPY
jgi:hypothetical protein